MGLKDAREGKLLYHLTALENMESIIRDGLKSRRSLQQEGDAEFSDIADPEIIEKRQQQHLDNYVPFHFHPYSAFDFAVKNNHPDKQFVYITITREFAKENGYKVEPQHPLSGAVAQPILYDYEEGFAKIDWDAVAKPGNEDEHVRCSKMAECLSGNTVQAREFHTIFVPDEQAKNKIEALLRQNGITDEMLPYVNVQEMWFRINNK